MGSLDNNTCELALIVLSADIKDNSKRIFPARIGVYKIYKNLLLFSVLLLSLQHLMFFFPHGAGIFVGFEVGQE